MESFFSLFGKLGVTHGFEKGDECFLFFLSEVEPCAGVFGDVGVEGEGAVNSRGIKGDHFG